MKAAEQTPLSILFFANLIKEAGFPPGVVNILNGHGRVAGSAIAQHMDIDKVAFTVSTATGKEIMKSAAINMKNITLETGGKSPLLVFDDADLDQAVKWSHIGIMSNAGQICTATSRILVQETIYDKFVSAFKKQVQETSKVGDPFSDETFQGPQVTKAQYERVLSYIEAGKSEGAELLMGGEAYKNVGGGKGFFVSPTVRNIPLIFVNAKLLVTKQFAGLHESKLQHASLPRGSLRPLRRHRLVQRRRRSVGEGERYNLRVGIGDLHQGYRESA